MPRPVALHVLQTTPTSPLESGPENRLCIKCGRFDGMTNLDPNTWKDYALLDPREEEHKDILFLGTLDPQDKEFLLKITRKGGYDDSHIAFVPSVLCGSSEPDPAHLRMCRAFILGIIRDTNPGAVFAIGSDGLAVLRGKSDLKNVDSVLGREIEVEEFARKVPPEEPQAVTVVSVSLGATPTPGSNIGGKDGKEV